MQEKSYDFLEFYRRLSQVFEKEGFAISAVESRLGFGRGTLNNAIKHGSALGIDKVLKIVALLPDTDLNWLLTGEYSSNYLIDSEKNLASEPTAEYGKKPSSYDIANLDKRLRLLEIQVKSLDTTSDHHAMKIAEVDSKVETVLREFIKEHS